MFRNLKFGAKIGGGFAIILLLVTLMAYVGYDSLSGVVERVDRGDDVNRLVKGILAARQQEKNFIIREDESYVAMVDKEIQDVLDQATATKEKLKQKVNKDQMDAVIEATKRYLATFHAYVDLERAKGRTMEEMRAQAREALAQLEGIREDKKKQLLDALKKSLPTALDQLAKADDANHLIKLFLTVRKNEKEFIITDGGERWKELHRQAMSEIMGLAKGLRARFKQPINIKRADEAIAALKAYDEAFARFADLMKKQDEGRVAMLESAREAHKECLNARATQRTRMSDEISTANTAMLVGVVIALLIGSTFAFFITRAITGPLKVAVDVANKLGSGELDVEIKVASRDEAGQLLSSMQDMAGGLRRQIQEIKKGANVLGASSQEILALVSQLASSTAETATAVDETVTTVEEVKQTADVSNEKAGYVANIARDARGISIEGRKSAEVTLEAMNRIKEQMDSIAESSVHLSEQSQAIGGIISTVDDLADQSNLLAVNASIEAARAGEHGKGFAVVAQAIKSLAEQSKQSTKAVRAILNDIQKAISESVMVTEQGSKAVDAGVQQAVQAGTAIKTLSDSIGEAAEAAIQIAASTQQQLSGMDQIAQAMESIKQATSQNASSSAQSERTARDLGELGQNLNQLVEMYKV